MAWSTSTRSKRLPPDWNQRKRQARANAQGRCQADHHEPQCDGRGSECDHIIPGDNHDQDNLQWLSAPCHAAKTRRENAANNQRLAKLRRRPSEQHPGKLG